MTDTAAIVAESRAAQGLPPKVADLTALRRVAALLALRDTGARPGPDATVFTFVAASPRGGRHDPS